VRCVKTALAQVWIESKAKKCKERATCSCVGVGEPHQSTSESVRLYYTGSIVIVSILSLSLASICTFSIFSFAAGWWSCCAFAKRLSLSPCTVARVVPLLLSWRLLFSMGGITTRSGPGEGRDEGAAFQPHAWPPLFVG
jgi:hypothetical protein